MKLKQIPTNTVVHTPTKEEAKELLSILHENGWKWIEFSGEEDDITYWDRYEHKTCYNLKPGKIIDTEERNYYASEGYTILTFSKFKERYCEAEKPQPKFKVGDKVKIVNVCNPMMLNEIGIIEEHSAKNSPLYKVKWCEDSLTFIEEVYLEPYTEPETKPTEDVETKELDLCELLEGHTDKLFYSPYFGEVEVSIDFCSVFPIIVNGEHLTNDGRLYLTDDCMPTIFPSRALYEQYPLEPLKAWMKWQEEQKKYTLAIACNCPDREYSEFIKHINFRTPTDRDKCIEEIKAIIEKYSKK